MVSKLNDEQRCAYNTIMKPVELDNGGVFFLYGYEGTGKTFVWKTLSSAIRSKGETVLNVASSGIASLLLPDGKIVHSRFAIPLNPNEDSTCNIKQGTPLAKLIVKCKLIIWEEAPMMNTFCFEALDKSMRDILRFSNPMSMELPFGEKIIVFGGDFRQIMHVIPTGSRQDNVLASINSLYLWRYCKVLRLTKNMRLQNLDSDSECVELKLLSEWISSIRDGTISGLNNGHATVKIPNDLLITRYDNPVDAIVSSTYPTISNDVHDTLYLQGRAILAPTLDVVESMNEYMISLTSTEVNTYLSFDSTYRSDSSVDLLQDIHKLEFLNEIRCFGVPTLELKLKVGTPMILLRNIDHSVGLCNGTKLVITRLGKHVLEAKILARHNARHTVLIPIMTLTPSDPRLPFKFTRR